MGPMEGARVAVQQQTTKPGDAPSWQDLREADSAETFRETANSNVLSTNIIEARPGPFRFVISIDEDFDWSGANGIRVVLTFDEGRWLSKYLILLLKPGGPSLPARATELNLTAMQQDQGSFKYYLDSVPLPKGASDPNFYKTTFVFQERKLGGCPVPKSRHKVYISDSDLARLKIEVTPCEITDSERSRPVSLDQLEFGSHEKSHEVALEKGFTLEAAPKHDTGSIRSNYSKANYRVGKGHQKRTFVFLYREAASTKSTSSPLRITPPREPTLVETKPPEPLVPDDFASEMPAFAKIHRDLMEGKNNRKEARAIERDERRAKLLRDVAKVEQERNTKQAILHSLETQIQELRNRIEQLTGEHTRIDRESEDLALEPDGDTDEEGPGLVAQLHVLKRKTDKFVQSSKQMLDNARKARKRRRSEVDDSSQDEDRDM